MDPFTAFDSMFESDQNNSDDDQDAGHVATQTIVTSIAAEAEEGTLLFEGIAGIEENSDLVADLETHNQVNFVLRKF